MGLNKGLWVSLRRLIYFFLGAAFLAAGFLAALGFLAAGFLAAFLGFLAAGFLALGFFALGFLAALGSAASLKEPAPFLPAVAAETTALEAIIFLRASLTRAGALAASTL